MTISSLMGDETAPNESNLLMNRRSNYGKKSFSHIKNGVLSFSAIVRNHYFKLNPESHALHEFLPVWKLKMLISVKLI